MSSSTPDATSRNPSSRNGTRAAVLTVSDSCSRGEKVDLSGPAVAKALERRKFQVVVRSVVADEFFFFNDTATTEIYTLSLHDALPIFGKLVRKTALARFSRTLSALV